ncbi:hypothetical protein TUZN_0652 [Thermoproteus uzoniensis 768-20]|uniref:Uncharacterized protein n=1 Tax=Thermoproteus uzoniensis (strain 768-20) TaxID=999630 RepID=F2L488_THEU7|nr:hypothetical protein TUZN_0652 [Thermoproteus uzoniensis 768-20]
MEIVEEYLYLLLEAIAAAVFMAVITMVGEGLIKDIILIYKQSLQDIKYMINIIRYENII